MTTLLPVLSLALFLALLLLGMLVFALYMILGGAGKRMGRLRQEVSPRFLRETAPTLLPWDPKQGLEDLSSLCRGRAESSALGGGMYHARGTMQSRSQTGVAWLAYTVNVQRRNGTATVRTSAHEVVAEVNGQGAAERHARIRVDGRLLGTVRIASSEILDVIGRPLGRVTGGMLITTYGTTNYRAVDLNGRRVAQINSNLLHPGQRFGPPPPAFRTCAPDPSPEEAWWLLALLALELYADRNRLSL